ncbi:MAG: GAF domain-containing protein, partial [Anaerolineae bacterium]
MSNEGMKRFGLAARAELMQLNEQLERKVKELSVLFEIGKSVTSLSNLEKLLSRIVEAAVYITGAEEGALLLLDEATGDLYMRAQRGLNERYASEFKLKVEDTIAGSVVKTGQPVMLDMSQANESFKMKTRYFVKSLLIVPLKVGEEVIGVLSADNQLSNRPFTEHNLNMLSALADYAAIAIENA